MVWHTVPGTVKIGVLHLHWNVVHSVLPLQAVNSRNWDWLVGLTWLEPFCLRWHASPSAMVVFQFQAQAVRKPASKHLGSDNLLQKWLGKETKSAMMFLSVFSVFRCCTECYGAVGISFGMVTTQPTLSDPPVPWIPVSILLVCVLPFCSALWNVQWGPLSKLINSTP